MQGEDQIEPLILEISITDGWLVGWVLWHKSFLGHLHQAQDNTLNITWAK